MVAIIGTALHWSDILVLLLYFLLILGFGIWSSCKNRGSVVQQFFLLELNFNKTMTQLNETLTKCAKDISGFAFAQFGYLTFGIQIEGFRAFQYFVYTLFLIILGSFDFPALQQAHRVLGPIFFLTYVFFVFFVLLNMFLAIKIPIFYFEKIFFHIKLLLILKI
ncbi:unnamed protein product [Adineta steineri]|uniref:Polycystin cation channel PKD1/PKD2 domain-containing protein n=1 Tax=Adineta steineri TaxID=433720 RepID=A0A820D6T6_9BILA|nr:unnamed protein product [Adineta steineri]